MKKTKTLLLSMAMVAFNLCYSQVGIETTNPQGSFHVDPLKNNPTTGVPTEEQQLDDLVVTQTGKVGIGTTTPQAALEIKSNTGGVAVPRLTTEQINALVLPAKSSIVFNTTTEQLNYNSGTPEVPVWYRVETDFGPPKQAYFATQNNTFNFPTLNTIYTFNQRLIPRSEDYDHSLFSYNTPSNGRITIIKKGFYELCAKFGGGNYIGIYTLHANVNGQRYILVRNQITTHGAPLESTDCDYFNFTQDNNIVTFTGLASNANFSYADARLFHITVRKIDN